MLVITAGQRGSTQKEKDSPGILGKPPNLQVSSFSGQRPLKAVIRQPGAAQIQQRIAAERCPGVAGASVADESVPPKGAGPVRECGGEAGTCGTCGRGVALSGVLGLGGRPAYGDLFDVNRG